VSSAATALTLCDPKKFMWVFASTSAGTRHEVVAKETGEVSTPDVLIRNMTGIEATMVAKKERIEFIVLDVRMPEISGVEAISQLQLRAGENVTYITSAPLDWGAEMATTRVLTTFPQVTLAGFPSSTAEMWEAQALPKKTVSIWSLVSDLFANPSLQNLRAALYVFYTSTLLLTMAGFGWIMVDFTNAIAGKPSFFESGEALFAAFGVAGLIIELSLGLLADMRTPGKIHDGNS